ncbi:MAG: hypothetical protein FWG03_07510 [Clostridiales bacterium]|nr:hypothetical protein [Clostridiales bacterium]
MERKLIIMILGIEAVACVVFCVLQTSFTGAFTAAAAFPFEQIGTGLRSLSLSGGPGNAVAIVIYAAVCLLPAAALLFLRKKRRLYAEDGLLAVLSVVLFAVLYIMINPGLVNMLADGAAGQPSGKAVLGTMVYSVLCGYLILRVLRLFSSGGTEKLLRYMSVMLNLLNVLFVFLVFGACFSGLLGSITALQAGNTGNEGLLGTTYVFLALQFIVDALPYAIDVLVVFATLRLFDEMRADRYSAGTVAAAGQASRLCAKALAVMVLANIAFNLLQLLFAGSLFIINSSVQIPLFSIAFVLAALLFTRLVTENKKLKDDNDLFV